MNHLGQTRSAFKQDHLLQTPDTFVRAPLPGMTRATAVVHCAPALGANFTEYTAEFESGGTLGPPQAQRFAYVLEGAPLLEFENARHPLQPGSFVYLPENCEHRISAEAAARVAIIEKSYLPVSGLASPAPVVSHESTIPFQPLLEDDALQVRSLLPNDLAFDFAVNVLSYQPGASLPMVEIHVMEHGLLMLQGEGIYRLGDRWYPVQAGDFIWMRAFCPQWFGALGKVHAKYLIYKDWNRAPLP
ncbi:MAG TPA: (S)-ureidoglycine aminohydrolase [Bryobacteraceae bacterium]|jgi:(S)-ureidoglycine aminohydrolase|nr:(S)-ureidoglycine aminohydrolase [Bryobacteraceae bacterium]